MPPDHSIVDIWPTEWRRLFSPLGALWLATLSGALISRGTVTPESLPDQPAWPAVVAVVIGCLLAWAAVGLAALCAAGAVQRLWLSRWPRLGALLTHRRRRRWWNRQRAVEKAVAAGDEVTARRRARQRNAIASAEPQCPSWTADRWAAVETRVSGAYGLDVMTAWPRLWLTLEPPVRAELRLAAAQWHRACVWASWAVLFAAVAPLWWPAGAVAALLAGLAWPRGRWSVGYRADLVEATFDTFGARLAEAMGVPLTPPGRLNPTAGEELTARIRKGA